MKEEKSALLANFQCIGANADINEIRTVNQAFSRFWTRPGSELFSCIRKHALLFMLALACPHSNPDSATRKAQLYQSKP